MQAYEYKVVPAPRRGEKARGARTTAERFAVALAHVMNDLGRDGWEYLRADTLPCDERVGLTGSATHFHHMLVFRRSLPLAEARAAAPAAELLRPVPPVAPPTPTPAPVLAEEPTRVVTLVPRAPEGSAPPVGPAAGRQPPAG